MAGTVVSGPSLLLTWNRVPGDNGTNTWYRLYVQDLSRQSAALDVYTQNNFYGAYVQGGGGAVRRAGDLEPGLAEPGGGPGAGVQRVGSERDGTDDGVTGAQQHGDAGEHAAGVDAGARGDAVRVLRGGAGSGDRDGERSDAGASGAGAADGERRGTVYNGIVRACPAGATCQPGLDTGWGPWSNAPGGPGVTNFTVTP